MAMHIRTKSNSHYRIEGNLCEVSRTVGHPLGEREEFLISGWVFNTTDNTIRIYCVGAPDAVTSEVHIMWAK